MPSYYNNMRAGDWIFSSNTSKPDDSFIDPYSDGLTHAKTKYPDLAAAKPNWVSGNNIVIPDVRGRYFRQYGGNSGSMDGLLSDAIRNITGYFNALHTWSVSGVLYSTRTGGNFGYGDATAEQATYFDASRVVPTANENRPVTFVGKWYLKARNDANYSKAELDSKFSSANSNTESKVNAAKTELTNNINNVNSTLTNKINSLDTKLTNLISSTNQSSLEKIYPVGAIYLTMNNIDPRQSLGFGNWRLIAPGTVLANVDSSDPKMNASNMTGGSKTHTLTIDEMPTHDHRFDHAVLQFPEDKPNAEKTAGYEIKHYSMVNTTTRKTGGSKPHNNMQPFTTCYIWVRVDGGLRSKTDLELSSRTRSNLEESVVECTDSFAFDIKSNASLVNIDLKLENGDDASEYAEVETKDLSIKPTETKTISIKTKKPGRVSVIVTAHADGFDKSVSAIDLIIEKKNQEISFDLEEFKVCKDSSLVVNTDCLSNSITATMLVPSDQNESLASVSVDGKKLIINGLKEGETHVVIDTNDSLERFNEKHITKKITITKSDPGIESDFDSEAIVIGTEKEININTKADKIKAISLEENIAKVEVNNKKIKIIPISKGKTVISITTDDENYIERVLEFVIEIKKPDVEITCDSVTVKVGETVKTNISTDAAHCSVISNDVKTASVSILNKTITIIGAKEGTTSMIITSTDNSYEEKSIEIPIIVKPSVEKI